MTTKPFAWEIKHWPDAAAFAAHLAARPPLGWAAGATLHHTWKPEAQDWRGEASMAAIGRYYRATMRWSAGPHLFLCVGAPNPAHDGIWSGTPLTQPGIHAGPCNSTRLGIEVVGNFDQVGWSPPLAELVFGVLLALHRRHGWGADRLNGHRECMPGQKSCPGHAISMESVRAELHRRLTRATAPAPVATNDGVALGDGFRVYRCIAPTELRTSPSRAGQVVETIKRGDLFPAQALTFGQTINGQNGWLWRIDSKGWSHESAFEPV